jgi:hypothetical protein
VVLTPRCRRQVCVHHAGDGDNKPITGEITKETVKPLRRECRVIRRDRGDYARVLFYFAREAAGASSARHSLRPLMFRWRDVQKNSGTRREVAELCLQLPPTSLPATNAKRLRTGAKATKQSIFDLAMPSDGLLR